MVSPLLRRHAPPLGELFSASWSGNIAQVDSGFGSCLENPDHRLNYGRESARR